MKPIPRGRLFLILGLMVALGFVVCAIPYYGYRVSAQMYIDGWAGYAGRQEANFWFQKGKLRLLELSSDKEGRFTGRKAGDFEIWTWNGDTNSYWLMPKNGDSKFVEAFNANMTNLWANKQNEKK